MSVTPPLPLVGRWVLVTGATGGIGRAIAAALAADGANLLLHTCTQLAQAEEQARRFANDTRQAVVVQADLAHSQEREQLIEQVWQQHPLDVLVNNAGVDVLTGANRDLSFSEKLERLWQVDAQGTIHLSRGFGHRMRERGSGSIVNVGWDQAELGMAGDSGEMFATIKGSIMAFSRSLAKSLAPQVRVNCVAPGWIRTDWGASAPEYWQQRAKSESLLGRWGEPKDVAEVVRFLVSPAGEFVNGQVLAVNGGWNSAPSSFHDGSQ